MTKLRAVLLRTVLALTLLICCAAPAAAEENGDLRFIRAYLSYYEYYDYDYQAIENASDVDSLISVLQQYDPYCEYYTPTEYNSFSQTYYDSYAGIGVQVVQNEIGQTVLETVYAGTPAMRSGLRHGDVLLEVNSVSVSGKTLADVSEMLRGTEGSVVTISVDRAGRNVICSMQRENIAAPSIDYRMLDDHTAYLSIDHFTAATSNQVRDALLWLREEGMTALILDLRDCPGGMLTAAGDVAAMLTGQEIIYYTTDVDGYNNVYLSDYYGFYQEAPLAVLINENSASAAELLAAVIQEKKAGSLIGSGSYGKGVYQSTIALPSGGVLYLTLGTFETSCFYSVAAHGGVTPDVLLTDAQQQYDKALSWLAVQHNAADTLSLTVGSAVMTADGTAKQLTCAPFMRNNVNYIPLRDVITILGWELHYYNGNWYGFNGIGRLIVSPESKKIVSGSNSASIMVSKGVSYVPAAFLRNIGYEVSWEQTTKTIIISH